MNQESRDGELIEASAESGTGGSGTGESAAPTANFRRYVLWGGLVLLLVFGVFGVWAATAPLKGAVIAQGQLAADSSSKSIQHLRGGIVRRIAVEEGEVVDAGDLLVELDPTEARAELERVRARYVTTRAEAARLEAELEGSDSVTFPSLLQGEALGRIQLAQVRTTQRSIFTTRREALASELAELEERIKRLRGQVQGLESEVVSLNERIDSYGEEIGEWSDLYSDQLASKRDLREARRRKLELEGRLAARRAEIARLRSEIQSTRMQRTLRQREYRRDVAERLGEVRRQYLEARPRIPALEQTLELTRITAPVPGEVVDLQVHTIGGVVSRDKPLMKITPTRDRLIVRARVQPADINDVKMGQSVNLRFPALKTALLGDLEGEVLSISADTLQTRDKKSEYYLARIVVSEAATRKLRESGLDLQSGMPVSAMIETDARTLVSYLLHPITEMMSKSMREP